MASSLPLLTEQVSRPEIKVLNSTQENGNCSLMLACMVEKGDHVTYSWSQEGGVILPSPANCSHLLYLTLGPQHADNVYICTANNPISNRSQTFIPWSRCSPSSSGECPGGGSHVTLNDMRSVPTWTNCSASIPMAITLMFFSIVCKSFPCAFSEFPLLIMTRVTWCSVHNWENQWEMMEPEPRTQVAILSLPSCLVPTARVSGWGSAGAGLNSQVHAPLIIDNNRIVLQHWYVFINHLHCRKLGLDMIHDLCSLAMSYKGTIRNICSMWRTRY